MTIPLEEGFTVVTGPNGSGKSNILDGVLFCLGLATSRGMRADRLPDLVNSGVLRAGKSAETVVSVRFDLSDWQPDPAEEGLEPPSEGPWISAGQREWTVTRRLRVMPGGSYSSSYSVEGEPCNLQQLQTQLRRLRIDPEGSNVVMQGDVTRIVSMSNKDRRSLIDELAGVALFDNRIEQTRSKLDEVYERQERCRIVEQELQIAKQRLEKDCAKARTYQELRERLHLGRQQELVLAFEDAKNGLVKLKVQQEELSKKEVRDIEIIAEKQEKLSKEVDKLQSLQENVKALGEDKLLSVQAELAGLDTQSRELDRQAIQHKQEGEHLQVLRQDLLKKQQDLQGESKAVSDDPFENALKESEQICVNAESAVEVSRRRLGDVAGRSGAWLDEQKKLSTRRKTLQEILEPLRQEQQTLQERLEQSICRQKEFEIEQDLDSAEDQKVQEQLDQLDIEWKDLVEKIKNHKISLAESLEALSVKQRTRNRLQQEQARLERDLARIESRRETVNESRGIGALRLLLEAGIEGIHGLVAQLGNVDAAHRLALDVAAGTRLGQIVVDDDRIAAKAIEMLKKRRAGRLTFLPLNRIKTGGKVSNFVLARTGGSNQFKESDDCLGRAIDLVQFEPVYKDVFAYVFGETLVFKNLSSARVHLGQHRAVTLDGELLEKTGAMTGGSFSGRSIGLSFGSSMDSDEAEPLRKRLIELGEALVQCSQEEASQGQAIEDLRPKLRSYEQRQAALEAERQAARRANGPLLDRRRNRLESSTALHQRQKEHEKRLEFISQEMEPVVSELEQLEKKETASQLHGDSEIWNKLQKDLELADVALNEARVKRDQLLNDQRKRQLALERLGDQQQALLIEESRLKDLVEKLTQHHALWKEQQQMLKSKRFGLETQQKELQELFGEQRRARDQAEAKVADQRQKLQMAQWNLEKLREERESLAEELRNSTIRIQESEKSLPDPLPEIPQQLRNDGLDALRITLQQLQDRMEALEPVNMLALEELEKLEERLQELVQRLQVLDEERGELLLRIETVGTLRQEAFLEAFEAVDSHFREIFASLSEGDGHLQLDNPDDPLEGGLTLVAHPKGKSVRRLAAMSGGEKSLTALSFLFALQRFRPSPFYALDEVDSFLDGINVERLAALIARQAQQAQFLVVSHRRPMIGASSRTIGVTQARGAHTQVVGLPEAA